MIDDTVVAVARTAHAAALAPPAARGGRPGLRAAAAFGLAGALAWDALGADLPLARLAGNAGGFPWREHWLLTTVLHDGARLAAWALMAVLAVGLLRPRGALRRLSTAARWQLVLTPLLAAGAVSMVKHAGGTSCPWDLQAFGGNAMDMPHWLSWLVGDGGPGGCFPAGHASTAFGFVGGWFVFRDIDARLARRWLAGAALGGLVLGLSQQWRGAHFASHTVWAAWLCFVVALLLDAARRRLAR